MRDEVPGILTKIKESMQYRGLAGTLRFCAMNIFDSSQGYERIRRYNERRFDQKFGVDTKGAIEAPNLGIESPAVLQANNYEGVNPVLFEDLIAGLRLTYADFTFVDFGSGKGKAILLASSFPFKKIIGVELSPQLYSIARENIKKYKSRRQRCTQIETICIDAAEFLIPNEPIVCYFYNPFGEQIMDKVLKNIEKSLQQNPRDLIVAYHRPKYDYLLKRASFLKNIRRKSWYSVYRSCY